LRRMGLKSARSSAIRVATGRRHDSQRRSDLGDFFRVDHTGSLEHMSGALGGRGRHGPMIELEDVVSAQKPRWHSSGSARRWGPGWSRLKTNWHEGGGCDRPRGFLVQELGHPLVRPRARPSRRVAGLHSRAPSRHHGACDARKRRRLPSILLIVALGEQRRRAKKKGRKGAAGGVDRDNASTHSLPFFFLPLLIALSFLKEKGGEKSLLVSHFSPFPFLSLFRSTDRRIVVAAPSRSGSVGPP